MTGTTKNPMMPTATPRKSVRLEMPAAFIRLPGMRNCATNPHA